VELEALSAADFERILTEPRASLTEQAVAMLKTEGVSLSFSQDGIERLANAAWQVNETTENIGARRLYTVMEKLLEEVSFDAADHSGQTILVDAAYVEKHLGAVVKDEDLSRFIL